MPILKHLIQPTSTFYFSKGANIVQPSLALLQTQQRRLMAQKQTPAFISDLENKIPNNSKYLKRPRIVIKNGNDSEVSFHESDSDYENAQMIFTKQKNKKISTNNKNKILTSSPKLPKFSSNSITVPKAHINNFESESSDLDIINNFSAKCEQHVMDPVELSDNSDIEPAEEFYSNIFKSQSQSNHKSTRIRKTGTPQEYNFEESIFDSSSKETPELNADMKEILQKQASTNHLLDAMALFSTENEAEALKEKNIVFELEPTINESSVAKSAPSPKKPVRSIVNNLKASLQNPSMVKGTDDKKMFFLTQRSNTVDAISREGSDIPKLADDAKSTRKVLTANILSDEQRKVVELAKLGANIFYTGAAGTGKSVLLRAMIKELKSNFEPGEIVVTASTGLAACNIGGITLHSFAGIGLGSETPDFLLKRVRKSKTSRERWQTAKLLIIDEISMIDAELLDKLDYIARNIKKKVEPFGGIQLIFCGDFFQLPPVVKNNETRVPGSFNDGSAPVGDRMTKHFAFNSKLWKDAIKYTIVLQKVFRQKGDLEFIEMLNEIRQGEVSNKTEEEFRKLDRKLNLGNNIVPTQLYPTRREVEISNNDRLTSLTGEATHYQATEGGTLLDKVKRKKILDNFLAVDELKLKPGAQVMMIKNIDSTLVNGSLGKVICFMNRETYAVSLSKGSSYSDSDSVFDFIEKPTPDQNSQQNFNCTRKIKIHKDLKRENRDILLPLVRFYLPDGSTRSILVEPEEWVYEDELQKPLVTKVQLPLILAWSLSIHKSQGLTLPFCTVDLSKIFEKGQAYVALSRAVSRSGLQVLNFRRDKIFSHKSVLEFYKTLSSANEAILAFTEDMAKQKKCILSEVSKPPALKKKPAPRFKATNKEPNDPLQRSLEFFGMVKRERPDLNLDVLNEVSSLNTPAEESKVDISQNIETH